MSVIMPPASKITGVPGWLTEGEEDTLIRYTKRVRADGVIVNIGVEYGRSMAAIAKHKLPSVSLIGVEIAPKQQFDENMQKAGLSGKYKIVTGDSKDIGRQWSTMIDMIFIDGAHEYTNVKGDIASWVGHVKPQGFLLFHDVASTANPQPHPLHYEVSQAINEWYEGVQAKWKITHMVDSIVVFKRVL